MNKGLIAALAVLSVSGCSTMQVASAPDTVDRQYMASIEQAAKRYGTQVVWVNLPQKRPTSTQ